MFPTALAELSKEDGAPVTVAENLSYDCRIDFQRSIFLLFSNDARKVNLLRDRSPRQAGHKQFVCLTCGTFAAPFVRRYGFLPNFASCLHRAAPAESGGSNMQPAAQRPTWLPRTKLMLHSANGIRVTQRAKTWPQVENAACAAGKDLVQVLERLRRVTKAVCRVLVKPPARRENWQAERRLRWCRSRRLPNRWHIIAARLGGCRPEKAVRGFLVPENAD